MKKLKSGQFEERVLNLLELNRPEADLQLHKSQNVVQNHLRYLRRNAFLIKSYILLIAFNILNFSCIAQKNDSSIKVDCPSYYDSTLQIRIYTFVDSMPEYPGGEIARLEYLSKNFQYPTQDNFQGSVNIELIVYVDGSIQGLSIRNKNLSEISPVERELIALFKKMPKWIPGKCQGKAVPVKMYIPIRF